MDDPQPITLDGPGLSDDQIELLLQQAEARLQNEATALTSRQCNASEKQSASLGPTGSVLPEPYVNMDGVVAKTDASRLLAPKYRKLAGGIRKMEDPVALKTKQAEEKNATAGAKWFNLPRTELTPELKRDLQLLRMRNVLDPKRHYKKDNTKPQIPEFSQVGTLVEGPSEFYSARLQNRERKRTLVEEVLSGERETGRFKNRYDEIQEKKRSGKKGHYKAQMAKRYGRRFNG